MITARQEKLLEFLRSNDNEYMSQYGISQALPHLYFYEGDAENFHNSKARQLLTRDIRAINADEAVKSIIVSGKQGVKIATNEEFVRGMKLEFASIFRRLKRAYGKARKGDTNGQFEFDTDLNIVESTVFKEHKKGESKQK